MVEEATTISDLNELPLSKELLSYYRQRLEASEEEMRGLHKRIDACAATQASQHKQRWETLKRMDEITDLQKALSDSHIYLWEEREKCQKLQAENDELKIQELEDRRKIQHLLSLVDPLVQDTTYVDSLLLTVEALRTQLQQSEQLSRERVAALLEDRRLRIAEERARRGAESERAQEADAALERTERMLHQYTKDFLTLKHESLTERRTIVERLEAVLEENELLKQQIGETTQKAASEVHAVNASAKSSAEQYIALYRQQVADTERTMSLLKDQHNGLQQALAMRVKELEATIQKLKVQYKALEERRGLEVEGFTQEISLMRKKVQRLELKAYGHRLPLQADGQIPPDTLAKGAKANASAKVAHGARALRAMQARVDALEKNLLTLE